MPPKGSGPAWQILFNNTYPGFGSRRKRATKAQNEEPAAPAQIVEARPQIVEVAPQAQPGVVARAPSPEPAAGQNAPDAAQEPVPRRQRRQNIPRAEQRPLQNDDRPQAHDEVVDLPAANPRERLNRADNPGAPRRRPRDNDRPEARVEPVFVRRPGYGEARRPIAHVEPFFVVRHNMQGHGQARHRHENPRPRHQRWARDIENSRGRGNSRSDARIIVESDTVSNASSSGPEDFMTDPAPPARPLDVDREMANAYFDTSSTASAIDDSRESRTGNRSGNRSGNRTSNRENPRNVTAGGLRGILRTDRSSYRRPSVSEANER